MTPAELPSSDGHSNPLNAPQDAGSGMLSLTSDQLSTLGLEDCQPGDSYTIKITKADSEGGDASFEVDDVKEGGDEADAAAPAPDDASEAPTDEGAADSAPSESKLLGYKRKSKPAREGLPDSKKMREVL